DHWLGWWPHGGSALLRSYHNERAVRRGWPTSSLYRSSQALVAISRGVEERLIAAGAPARAVHRVGGVVDTARFAADSRGAAKIREEFHVASAPLIGCVARFAAGRGHEALLEGFRLLRRERPDARLLLVGKGERRQALEAAVKELGLEDSALFAGYRDIDLPAVLHALDIFVLLGAGSDESCRAALGSRQQWGSAARSRGEEGTGGGTRGSRVRSSRRRAEATLRATGGSGQPRG